MQQNRKKDTEFGAFLATIRVQLTHRRNREGERKAREGFPLTLDGEQW
jgi:hypothetical protein